ncbi:ATP-binding protein [Planomonospora venezuelensis]|uniref:ATP-binding protein n=1 Tax=Planomonospora venezuelensis TaxID=1999 RepID=A0A841DD29_PLAVE|nr:ATP-binding protein [Planomonospora venezuelensis]MBB5966198.1 hypothetical protein [Planomonospora venezuelensis]
MLTVTRVLASESLLMLLGDKRIPRRPECVASARRFVRDSARDWSVPDDVAETGRGLALVQTLAANWGYSRTPYGKSVFFELPAWP